MLTLCEGFFASSENSFWPRMFETPLGNTLFLNVCLEDQDASQWKAETPNRENAHGSSTLGVEQRPYLLVKVSDLFELLNEHPLQRSSIKDGSTTREQE